MALLARAVLGALGLLAVAGCTEMPLNADGNYVRAVGNARVTDNPTSYSRSLACLSDRLGAALRDRFAYTVGRIEDYTGKDDYYTGRVVTQGAALMAMSALRKAGLRQVERFDTSVAQAELQYANNKLISDENKPFREILSGSIEGSDFYLVGGITELNFNIFSSSVDVLIDKFSIGGRFYVLNVGLDLRLVDTRSLEVVDVVSYQQQIMGRELRAGLFEFLDGDKPLDIGIGERTQEPIQRGVRAVVERAVVELIGKQHGLEPAACLPAFDQPKTD
jgi:curli production assembly/transport component CsgG/holdfast attachment protein HfaB